MKKRLLALTLAMVMAGSALVACDNGNAGGQGGNTPATSTNVAPDGSAAGSGDTSAEAAGYTPVARTKNAPIFATSTDVSNDGNEYADETGEFVIWGWNTDISNILDNVYKTYSPDNYARIRFVNTEGSNTYQEKVDGILTDPTQADYPDIMGLEVDYVQKYVNSGCLLTAVDLGITADDCANAYAYNLALGSSEAGDLCAFFWQATPGCFEVRADLAEQYLGTTDPQELHDQFFCDADTLVATAKDVWEASEGTVALFSGYDELLRMYQNSRGMGWYDANDKVLVDSQMQAYMDVAQALYPYTFNTAQWGDAWNAAMLLNDGDDMAAIAFCGCPWFSYWSLKDEWAGNTILVEGPFQFFWGGTGLAATVGCCDRVMAAEIIRLFSCDTDFMTAINAYNGDFVNNTAVEGGLPQGLAWAPYGDQDVYAFFKPLADNINANTVTAEDQDINAFFNTQVSEYAQGNKDKDTAIADFKAAVVDKFTYLSSEF